MVPNNNDKKQGHHSNKTTSVVSFCEHVRTLQIPNCVHLLSEDNNNNDDDDECKHHMLWYSKGELNLIIRQARNVIRRFEASGDCYRYLLSSNDDIRGLERGTDMGYDRSRRRKHSVIQSVLNEQERQKKLGIHDEHKLRQACVSISTRCVQDAIDMAIIDSMAKVVDEKEKLGAATATATTSGFNNDEETTNNTSRCWLFSPPVTWFGNNNKKSLYSKFKPPPNSCRPESKNTTTTTTIRVLWGKSKIDRHHRRLTRF